MCIQAFLFLFPLPSHPGPVQKLLAYTSCHWLLNCHFNLNWTGGGGGLDASLSHAKPDKNTSLQILYNCCIYFNTCLQNGTYFLKLYIYTVYFFVIELHYTSCSNNLKHQNKAGKIKRSCVLCCVILGFHHLQLIKLLVYDVKYKLNTSCLLHPQFLHFLAHAQILNIVKTCI